MTEQELSALFQAQRRFFASGATKPHAFRHDALKRLYRTVRDNEAALLKALSDDLGKPEDEAWVSEFGAVLSETDYALSRLRQWMRPRGAPIPLLYQPSRGYVRYEPFGTCLVLSPWNYPLALALTPLVSALAAGNCAVLKPSSKAPRTSREIARMVTEAFPAEHVFCIEGGARTAELLLGLGFDFIFYTGSARIGRKVMAQAARTLTPVVLELGGKSPCIVDRHLADGNIDKAARRIVWGKLLNAGQTCVAPDFVLAHAGIKAELEQALVRAVIDFFGPDPSRSPHLGRIVSQEHYERLAGLLASTRGRRLFGGDNHPGELYMAPAVVTDMREDDPLMAEEIFGPILPVMGVESLDKAMEFINSRPRPLALYLFTESDEAMARVLRDTASGGVCINDTALHLGPHALPFGGVGESGMGRYHGQAGFEAFSYQRGILRRGFRFDWKLRYPPRSKLTGFRKALLRWLG